MTEPLDLDAIRHDFAPIGSPGGNTVLALVAELREARRLLARKTEDYGDAVQSYRETLAERDALQARIDTTLAALYPPDWTADPDRIEAARRALGENT